MCGSRSRIHGFQVVEEGTIKETPYSWIGLGGIINVSHTNAAILL